MAYIGRRFRGDRLKELRTKNGYSQQEIADCCGVMQYQTVGKWEKGSTFPSMEDALKMCDLLDCDFAYLIGEIDCTKRTFTDAKMITGLSEAAIRTLQELRVISPQSIDALNQVLTFNNADLLQLIKDYLLYDFSGSVSVGDIALNGDNLADIFVLEIGNELMALRKKYRKGDSDGKEK